MSYSSCDSTPHNRKIVIKTQKTTFRNGKRRGKRITKKCAVIYIIDDEGFECEALRITEPTYRHLSRRLRRELLIPENLVINKRGETFYTSDELENIKIIKIAFEDLF